MSASIYVRNYIPCGGIDDIFPKVKIGYSLELDTDSVLSRVSDIQHIPGFILEESLKYVPVNCCVEEQEILADKICSIHRSQIGFIHIWDLSVADLNFYISNFDNIIKKLNFPLAANAIDLAYQIYFNQIVREQNLYDYVRCS